MVYKHLDEVRAGGPTWELSSNTLFSVSCIISLAYSFCTWQSQHVFSGFTDSSGMSISRSFCSLNGCQIKPFLTGFEENTHVSCTMHNQHLRKDRASENFCLAFRYLHISCQHQRILLYRTPRRMYTVIRNEIGDKHELRERQDKVSIDTTSPHSVIISWSNLMTLPVRREH